MAKRTEILQMSEDELRAHLTFLQTNRQSPQTRRAQKKRTEKVIKGIVKPIELDLL